MIYVYDIYIYIYSLLFRQLLFRQRATAENFPWGFSKAGFISFEPENYKHFEKRGSSETKTDSILSRGEKCLLRRW